MRVATWNINSVRLRAEQVKRFVAEAGVDLLLLQETKCREAEFPFAALAEAGLPHVRVAGQKGSHGVATASRTPLEDAPGLDLCREGHARCLAVRVGEVEVVNLYIPAGGDTPDRAANPKFDHKLDFYERLTAAMAARDPGRPLLLGGDFNIAPGEDDVWDHRHMLKVVSHTPVGDRGGRPPQGQFGLHRPRARGRPARREAVHLVELSRGGLPRLEPRPAARPPVGLAGPGPARLGRPRSRSRPRLGAAQRPRPGHRRPGDVTSRRPARQARAPAGKAPRESFVRRSTCTASQMTHLR